MSLEAESLITANRKSPVVCYVTDRAGLATGDSVAAVISTIRAAISAGADWVQIREKDLTARDLLVLASAAVRVADEYRAAGSASAHIIVNDRLDVALAAGAGGIHLGSESIPAADVVRWCRNGNAPANFLIGVSCHSLKDACRAEDSGASYVIFGPVFDTPSKKPFGPPQGIAKLADVCSGVRLPVIAIGGVDGENAAQCIRAGAAGVAAIRLFQAERNVRSLSDWISKLHHPRKRA